MMRRRMGKEIREKVYAAEEELAQWFHHLHEYPELGFEERKTSAFVAERLKSFPGVKVKRLTPTGILGVLDTGRKGRCVAFRADMDALPIEENDSHRVCSKHRGVMHACGHDGHTASLLMAAKILSEMREELRGEIRFLFQPSEEIQPGGAKGMVEQGVLEGVEYIFGLHYSIDEYPGQFSVHAGVNFASNDKFDITIEGKEGHAAFPHLVNDTVLAAVRMAEALNTLVPRCVDPASSAVLSVTKIHGGNTYNSLPDKVMIGGTIRTLDIESREVLKERISDSAEGLEKATGCRVNVKIEEGCTLLSNEQERAGKIKRILKDAFGEENVFEHPPVMGCEDFSEYLKTTKGIYFRAGARTVEEDGTVFPTHNSGFRLNEKGLPYGVMAILEVILAFIEMEAEK